MVYASKAAFGELGGIVAQRRIGVPMDLQRLLSVMLDHFHISDFWLQCQWAPAQYHTHHVCAQQQHTTGLEREEVAGASR